MVASANLLINGTFDNTKGSFEVNRDYGAMELYRYSTSIPGWTVVAPSSLVDIAWIGSPNPYLMTASPGNSSQYLLDLTGYNDGANGQYAGVSQTVPTTPGQTYQLTFDLGSHNYFDVQGAPGIQVIINNQAVGGPYYATVIGQNTWTTETMTFTASSGSTSILLNGVSSGGSILMIGLDNVTLTAVPEPTTMIAGALLLLPFGATTLRILRNRKSA